MEDYENDPVYQSWKRSWGMTPEQYQLYLKLFYDLPIAHYPQDIYEYLHGEAGIFTLGGYTGRDWIRESIALAVIKFRPHL